MRVSTTRADSTAARNSRPIVSPQVTRITYPVTGDNSPVDVADTRSQRPKADMLPRLSSSSHTPTSNNSNSQSQYHSLSLANDPDVSYYDHEVAPPSDDAALEELWGSIRQTKAKKMAKEKPKVQSLEEPRPERPSESLSKQAATNSLTTRALDVPTVDVPLVESEAKSPPPSAPQLQRQKSVTSFRESPDGRTMVASLDMRDVPKENIHVSFQRHRLVVTWATLEISEYEEEDGYLVREKYEKNYQRTFPLPEGTRFEEINGAMRGKYLLLKYPNCRAYRIEGRSDSGALY